MGAAALAAGCRKTFGELFPAADSRPRPLGIQLYTVRRLAPTDLPGTLSQIARIGYQEVELESYYNHPVSEWRDLLRENGLKAPSNHVTVEAIETSAARTFGDSHAIGVEWLVARSLPRGRRATMDDWKHAAAQFNSAASKAKADGFRFAFHNHNDVFKPVNGVAPIHILMTETDPALVSFELDAYWATSGGEDPLALFKRYPGRFRMLHIKDGNPPYDDPSQTDIGKGTIDFKPILAATRGLDHWFVESDTAKDPIGFAANAYQYINSLKL